MNLKDIVRGHQRRFRIFALAFVLVFSMIGASGIPAQAATAWVGAGIPGNLDAVYGYFHSGITNLPPVYDDYAKTEKNQCYFSIPDNHTIYCIEIGRHFYHPSPDESVNPAAHFTDVTKQKLATHVLANGQKFYETDEAGIRRQTATQLAIWLISDNYQDDAAILDAVLFPASGSFNDNEAFAPTVETGRIARKLLEDAKAFVAGGGDISTLLVGGPIPSFMTTTEAAALEFPMTWTGSSYAMETIDTNGTVGRDWPNHLKVTDSGGLHVLGYPDSKMRVTGSPQSPVTMIKLVGPYSGYEVRYLSSTETVQATGEPFQQMIRLARLDSGVPLFFKVSVGSSPTSDMANLNLNKLVVNGDVNKQFAFGVNFKTASGTDVTGVLMNGAAFKNGDPLALKHGATARFTNIPLGTIYTIVEASYASESYTSDKTNNSVSGTLTTSAAISVSYTNTYTRPNTPNTPNTPNRTTPLASRSPKTGDTFPVTTWIAVMLGAVVLISGSGIYLWNRARQKKRLQK